MNVVSKLKTFYWIVINSKNNEKQFFIPNTQIQIEKLE